MGGGGGREASFEGGKTPSGWMRLGNERTLYYSMCVGERRKEGESQDPLKDWPKKWEERAKKEEGANSPRLLFLFST